MREHLDIQPGAFSFEPEWSELEDQPIVGSPPRPVRARILWPALGFPAVIAPRSPPAEKSMRDADATRCICILLLSDRPYLSRAAPAHREAEIRPGWVRSERFDWNLGGRL